MMGTPSIANTNLVTQYPQAGELYIAYETSANDPNGSNHLGYIWAENSPSSHGLADSYVASTLIGSSPAITGYVSPSDSLSFQIAFQAYDPSHSLFIQTFRPFASGVQLYGNATPFPTQIGTTPAICNMDGAQNSNPMVAFLANDPSNHLWFEDFGYNGVTDTWNQGPAVQNNATIGGAPAIIAWTSADHAFLVTVAFKSNDTSNHLWIGSQNY
jgi:hypothetical protein